MRRRFSEFVRSRSGTGDGMNSNGENNDDSNRPRSQSEALHGNGGHLQRRRAESDYVGSMRYNRVNKNSSNSGTGGGLSPRRLRRMSFLSRGRSGSGRYGDESGSSIDGNSPRLGSRKDSSIHAVDLTVLESMQLSNSEQPELEQELTLSKQQVETVEDLEEEVCLICMSRFTSKKPSITIPCTKKCNLAPVHAKCIYEWKEQKKGAGSCPLCRSELGPIAYTPPDLLQSATLVMFHARKQFVVSPVPRGAGMIRCYIKAKNGFWGSPVRYEMYLQAPTTLLYPYGVLPSVESPESGDRLLLTASKRLSKWGSSVIDISMDERGKDYDRSGHNYIGTINGSVSGLEHTLVMPYKSNAHGSNSGGQRELLGVQYTQNRVGSASGPRRMQVVLPRVKAVDLEDPSIGTYLGESSSSNNNNNNNNNNNSAIISDGEIRLEAEDTDNDDDDDSDEEEVLQTKKYVTDVYRPKSKSEHMTSLLRKRNSNGNNSNSDSLNPGNQLMFGQNKEPYWLDTIQAYSLDFQGRVTLPSNKNFQLELDILPDTIAMQFGKVVASEEGLPFSVYTVDLQWPLSPAQAFGICLTSCDRKFAVA